MANIPIRILRVGIQVRGELRLYEASVNSDIEITIRAKKTNDATKNTATVTLTNLQRAVRNYILDATSPYNNERTKHLVTVEAGTSDGGYNRLFSGYIVRSSIGQPPDIRLTMEIKTGAYQSLDVAVLNYDQATNLLSVIGRDVAALFECRLRLEATDRYIRNFAHSGSKYTLVRRLNELPGVECYLDDEELIIKDSAQPLRALTTTLSEHSGLLGVPEVTEQGVTVRSTYTHTLTIGSELNLRSALNPSVNGRYEVFGLAFSLTSRSNDFSVTCDARRIGLDNKRATPTASAERETEIMVSRPGGASGLSSSLLPAAPAATRSSANSGVAHMLNKRASEIETQIPAMVISYDRKRNVARVKGMVMMRTSEGGMVPQATYAEVPVLAYGGGGVSMTFPLKNGDLGWIEASQCDISSFMDTLSESAAPTNRMHYMGDSRFIPDAFRNFSLPMSEGDAWCLQSTNGKTYVSLKEGRVNVLSSEAVNVEAPSVRISSAAVTISAETVTLDAPNTILKGNVTIQGGGKLNVNGSIYNDHYHIDGDGKRTSEPKNA